MRLTRERGTILIDVLLAIFIFGIGFASLYSLTEGAVQNLKRSATLFRATMLAQSKLEQAVNAYKSYQMFESSSPGEVLLGSENNINWLLSSRWTSIPDVLQIDVNVEWNEDHQNRNYLLTSLLYIPSP